MDSSSHILGYIFKNPVFLNAMNSLYFPLDAMVRTVKRLDPKFISTMTWGQYQPLLAEHVWSEQAGASWRKSSDEARAQLAKQPNADPVSRDDPTVPATRCDLLDASVRKCFSQAVIGQTDPGIPIVIDVKIKTLNDLGHDRHDVQLSWTYYPGSNSPVQLNLTMLCPYPSKSKVEKAAKRGSGGAPKRRKS